MYKHLLVPIDGSVLATELVTQSIHFAKSLDAKITFLNVKSDFSSTDQGALERSISRETYSEHVAGDSRGILFKAKSAASAFGIECNLATITGTRIAEIIVSAANEHKCDLIFMASHGYKGLKGLIHGSQTQKVLSKSNIPVLVSAIECNQTDRERFAAIATIQDEHRSIAAVVRGLQNHADEVLSNNAEVNYDLVKAIIRYLDAFPERLHHPKENDYLFSALRKRTAEFDSQIATLIDQHSAGDAHIREVEKALNDLMQNQTSTSLKASFHDAVNRFAQAQWDHMNLEENVIIPAAKNILLQEDWVMLYEAFSKNGDPQFDADLDDGFKRLYQRIANLNE